MARHWKIAIASLTVLAIIGLATLPTLLRTVLRLRHGGLTEEQARRELIPPGISTPTDAPKTAKLFWASSTAPTTLEPTPLELPLSADPVQRSKQLILALITRAPSIAQRTLPADTELLQFYILPDGTAIADFSEALSTKTPSGILSEQMAVDSLRLTLGENVSVISQLKIIIQGQEVDTLAGHIDLTGFFRVEPAASLSLATSDDPGAQAASALGVPASTPTSKPPISVSQSAAPDASSPKGPKAP